MVKTSTRWNSDFCQSEKKNASEIVQLWSQLAESIEKQNFSEICNQPTATIQKDTFYYNPPPTPIVIETSGILLTSGGDGQLPELLALFIDIGIVVLFLTFVVIKERTKEKNAKRKHQPKTKQKEQAKESPAAVNYRRENTGCGHSATRQIKRNHAEQTIGTSSAANAARLNTSKSKQPIAANKKKSISKRHCLKAGDDSDTFESVHRVCSDFFGIVRKIAKKIWKTILMEQYNPSFAHL